MRKSSSQKQIINFPPSKKADWRDVLPRELKGMEPGSIDINLLDWHLNCNEIKKIIIICKKSRLKVDVLRSNIPETIVAISAIGYQATLNLESKEQSLSLDGEKQDDLDNTLFHQGTIRSGEHLEAEGDLLVIGDINPGGQVSAEGDVMIWGRLRGIAHAGKSGNENAKIIALQLRPLQLRIAQKVARGPSDKPEPGLAEEAIVESGRIVIKPAIPKSHKR